MGGHYSRQRRPAKRHKRVAKREICDEGRSRFQERSAVIPHLPNGFTDTADISVEGYSAVDIDRLAGHGAGLLRTQEQRGARNFLRCLCASLKQTIYKTGELPFFVYAHFLCEHRA